jgi:SAM-dependent methyltransferase
MSNLINSNSNSNSNSNDVDTKIIEGNGHKYGNYHDYYSFHPSNVRTSLLPIGIFTDIWINDNDNDDKNSSKIFNVLDVGCNEGNLTVDIYNRIRSELSDDITINVIGIDIDPELIDRANNKNNILSNCNDSIRFITIDIMNSDSISIISKSKYHFISVFSVTMWIHLNHGDDGLKSFLYTIADLTTDNGSLLIEPQPWKCYKKASKRLRKLGMPNPAYYGKLDITDIEKQITIMMTKNTKNDDTTTNTTTNKLFTSSVSYGPDNQWGRKLILFQRHISRKRKLEQ